MPTPPELKPGFEKIEGEPPDGQHAGPAEKPTFVQVNVNDGVPRWLKLSAAVAGVVGAVFAALAFFFAGGGTERECKTIRGAWWCAEITRINGFNNQTESVPNHWRPIPPIRQHLDYSRLPRQKRVGDALSPPENKKRVKPYITKENAEGAR